MEYKEVEVLLVDDNLSDAELTMRALHKNNMVNSIIHLKDGEEALDFLFGTGKYEGRNINIKPRLLLLDLKMPKVSGLEVLTIIKANDITKKIPVVILTSSKENMDIERCYSLGANSYIVKPVDFDHFMKAASDAGWYWLLHNEAPV
jgi:two-component system, response regulator